MDSADLYWHEGRNQENEQPEGKSELSIWPIVSLLSGCLYVLNKSFNQETGLRIKWSER